MNVLSKDYVMRLAKDYAEQGFLCSEAVLLALSKCLDISSKLIPRIATGFGAGVGRKGEVCGAISGGVMGLGLCHGRSSIGEVNDEGRYYWFATELVDMFREKFGHVRCQELLGLDLSNADDLQEYRDKMMWETRCREIITVTTGLAFDLIDKCVCAG